MQEDKIIIHLHKPDNKELFFFFSSGIIVSVPLTLYAGIFSNHLCVLIPVFYSTVCSTNIIIPFIEEFAKAFPLFYRHGETEQSIFTLGFLVGLGFGITEFFVYTIGMGASVYARLPAVFFHAASTSITAYGIAIKRPVFFYLIASLLHLIINFFAYNRSFWFPGGLSALIITYFLSWHLFGKTTEKMIAQ
ncbi:MAG TPA: PrsW family glutamic-type intramembrane protease [Candidatus Methylomirabilis sp.]|nr:PrsW family glutamic-type intramembrane protease [Candidatus Methylomirabilis sp.]